MIFWEQFEIQSNFLIRFFFFLPKLNLYCGHSLTNENVKKQLGQAWKTGFLTLVLNSELEPKRLRKSWL